MLNLQKKISFLANNELIKNNFIILCGSLIAGFGNYLYNFAMIRMLTPFEYAELAALLSIFYIISIPSSAIQLSVSRFSAEMTAHRQYDKLSYFIKKTTKYFLILGVIGFIIFALFIPHIQSFLNFDSIEPLLVTAISIILLFIGPAGAGALQGMQKFTALSVSGIISSVFKLLLAIWLVWLGAKITGAVIAIVIAAIITILYIYLSLKLPKTQKKFSINKPQILKYSQTILIATFCITALNNVDIILIKHFWGSMEAANYSVLSLMGKIIFFITSTAALVMFPVIIDRHNKNKEHFYLLKYSFLLVLGISLMITGFYFIFPSFIVSLLLGKVYLPITPYLGYFGLIMLFLSLINLLVTYYLSINQTKFVLTMIMGVTLEIGLIYFFHNNIWQVMNNILFVMIFIFIGLIIRLFKNFKKCVFVIASEARNRLS